MLLPMLKAASSMLAHPSGQLSGERVACAKIIIDELIKFYEDTPIPENPKPVSKEKTQAATPKLRPQSTLEPKPEVEVPKDKEWLVTLDDSKNLCIEGFSEDGMVELDGKKMMYKETRGIKFTKARIL